MKKILLYLCILQGLIACNPNMPPGNNPNAKLAPVVFDEPVSQNPPKEQYFDFYLNPREDKEQRYVIGVEYWMPPYNDAAYGVIRNYFNNLSDEWQRNNGVSAPYFDVTLEHHLENGQVRLVPFIGIIRETFENSTEIKSFTTFPARLSVSCGRAEMRKDKAGNEYFAERCHMIGFRPKEIPDYDNGFFRLKIKGVKNIALNHNIMIKAMVLHGINYK